MNLPADPSPDHRPDADSADPAGRSVADRVARRRDLDRIFGEVLPEITGDEQGPAPDRSDADRWYLENRPPHHG
jgi:hypothetical protein